MSDTKQELTPEEQTECGRLMQHVLETECNADHVIRIGFTGVVRAYMTLAITRVKHGLMRTTNP